MEHGGKLYRRFGILWDVKIDPWGVSLDEEQLIAKPICPIDSCRCEIKEDFRRLPSQGVYYYSCSNPECSFEIRLDDEITNKGRVLLKILKGQEYRNLQIVDLDGELIPINERKREEDDDYWVDAKISKNKKGEKQLMVLAGSKKTKDKTQLFLDSSSERLGFDQNDTHPREVFAEVHAVFKSSQSRLSSKDE